MKTIKVSSDEAARELTLCVDAANKFGIGGSDSINRLNRIIKFYSKYQYITQSQLMSLQMIRANSKAGR